MSGDSSVPAVDVIISIHALDRPIERAVQSVLSGGLPTSGEDRVRITVICHHLSPALVQAELSPGTAALVRWLTCEDGIPSPAGPCNVGLAAADARYVCKLDSDDYLEPGALSSWWELARRRDADAVIAPLRHPHGVVIRTPPVRIGRSSGLDPIKDRVLYRTVPFGLVRTALIHREGLRMIPELATGEDQDFSARLWLTARRIEFPHRTPQYVLGDDAVQRVTSTPRPIAEEFAFMRRVVDSGWFRALPPVSGAALVEKLLRVNVLGAVSARCGAGRWSNEDRGPAAEIVIRLLGAAPHASRSLSRADVGVLRLLVDPGTGSDDLIRAAMDRRRFGRPRTLLTVRLRDLFLPGAPVRFIAASAALSFRSWQSLRQELQAVIS